MVLVLHSYHPGFTWTDAEQRGILAGLRKAAADVLPLRIERRPSAGGNGDTVQTTLGTIAQIAMRRTPSFSRGAISASAAFARSPPVRLSAIMPTW